MAASAIIGSSARENEHVDEVMEGGGEVVDSMKS